MKHHHNNTPHVPVLKDAVLKLLSPKEGDLYLDLTAGYGGHAEAVFNITGTLSDSVLVDRDDQSVDYLGTKFRGVNILHTDFVSALKTLKKENKKFDLVLMDLGVSSLQFDQAERGFSFNQSAALDMRMDQRQQLTASEIVNDYDEQRLADLIYEYGEEPNSRIIAKAIVSSRPIETTTELSELISNNIGRKGKTHPATRTFQAIRMAVNDELGQLRSALDLVLNVLNEEGRLAVISFHSLEDRIVKQFIRDHSRYGYEATLKDLTKRPISGTEDVNNPRARSAKLRAAYKIKTPKNKKKGAIDADSG